MTKEEIEKGCGKEEKRPGSGIIEECGVEGWLCDECKAKENKK